MMDQLIAQFPDQLEQAIKIGQLATVRPHNAVVKQCFVAGLGGSGIGGNFVAEMVRDHCPVPYLVGKGYDIPAYVGENTVAIASSYSGNTEETLSSFHQLLNTRAKLMVISSGGKLIELAKKNDLDYIQVPGDSPSPRACLGYSLVQQLFILNKLGLIENWFQADLESAAALLRRENEDIRQRAGMIAQFLHKKLPIIYTTDRMESVAVRFRQQVNENSKMLCWHHVIPEMNHNELVGWRAQNTALAVLIFRNRDDHPRNQARIEINKDIIRQYTSSIIEVYSRGKSLIEKMLYLVHLGDWISYELALLRGVDATEVEVIDYLKGALKKLPQG